MADSLAKTIISAFSWIPSEILVFFISTLPILELRGGLIAASVLGVDWRLAFIICVAGSILPIPLILLFVEKIFEFLKTTKLSKIPEFFEKKANHKSESFLKYKKWGLFAMFAIPLPGFGGWTGALIAALLKYDFKKTMLIGTLGTIVAGIIMAIVSYVIPGCFCR